jgi:hypothetical protein
VLGAPEDLVSLLEVQSALEAGGEGRLLPDGTLIPHLVLWRHGPESSFDSLYNAST